MYTIVDSETNSNVMGEFNTWAEAVKELNRFEDEDKKEGTYTDNFYVIIDEAEKVYTQFEIERNFLEMCYLNGHMSEEERLKALAKLMNHYIEKMGEVEFTKRYEKAVQQEYAYMGRSL